MVEPFALSGTLSWDKFLILSQDLERRTTDENLAGSCDVAGMQEDC